MNKYNDIFDNKGIATIFAENFATDFANFFGENNAAAVDAYTAHKYGDKWLSQNITENNAAQIVCAIIQINLQPWQKIHGALTAQYNAADSVNETKTKVGTIQRENLSINSEKAFNDTEFVGDTQTDANGAETYNLTETRRETNGDAVQNISREIELRKRQNLQLQIIETIINNICLTIY